MTRHVHVTTRDEPICDFCSGPGVEVRYPCSATVAMVCPIAVAESSDDWAACAACALVIAKRDPEALARHVLDSGTPEDPDVASALANPVFRAIAMGNLLNLYSRLLPVLGEPTTAGADQAGLHIQIIEEDDDGE